MTARHHSSAPDRWTQPRPRSGMLPSAIHGPLQPMETPRTSLIARLFGAKP